MSKGRFFKRASEFDERKLVVIMNSPLSLLRIFFSFSSHHRELASLSPFENNHNWQFYLSPLVYRILVRVLAQVECVSLGNTSKAFQGWAAYCHLNGTRRRKVKTSPSMRFEANFTRHYVCTSNNILSCPNSYVFFQSKNYFSGLCQNRKPEKCDWQMKCFVLIF